jgi:hypothetical protein
MRQDPSIGPAGGHLELPFHHKNTVEVFVRHTRRCPHEPKGKDFRKCPCPKYLYIYKDGEAKRLSAKTGSWAEAEKKAQEIRDSWVPELVELKRLRAEKEMGRLRMEEAVAVYIDDMRTRNQAKLTVANARSLFQSETNPNSLISWVARYNAEKSEDLRIVWLDQLDGTLLSRWRSEWHGAPLTLRNQGCSSPKGKSQETLMEWAQRRETRADWLWRLENQMRLPAGIMHGSRRPPVEIWLVVKPRKRADSGAWTLLRLFRVHADSAHFKAIGLPEPGSNLRCRISQSCTLPPTCILPAWPLVP